jgi:hypothetical protein
MPHRPLSVTVTLALILFNAALWLAFGLIVVMDLHPALPDNPAYKLILSLLAFGAVLILTGLTVSLARQVRAGYFLALAFLGVVALAFLLDDFGWTDFLFQCITILPAALLIKDRNWYLHHHSQPASTRSLS